MSPSPIRVLVVDDSKVTQMLMVHLLQTDPRIQVAGTAENGQAAIDFLDRNKVDLVLMDIHMPGMDGFETTRRIMETKPLPIVICSATANIKDMAVTFGLMEAGAVACLQKPVARDHPDYEALAARILETVKLMSEVKVVRRWPRARMALRPKPQPAEVSPPLSGVRVVGIGASTGGPPVLLAILEGMRKNFPAPILVVQHIARGFLTGFTDWLGQCSGFPVHIAAYGIVPQPGHVYMAPDDYHMSFSGNGRIVLTREEPEYGLRPSVSHLFRSLAQNCGPSAVGVLLSGMGKDGAAELKLMKEKGAVTIAQDRESSAVHGMPGEAIQLGGATYVMAADKIGEALVALVKFDHHPD